MEKVGAENKLAILGRLSKVGSGAQLIYTQFFKKESDANKLYLAILPSLKRTISIKSYNHDETKALIELLIDAAPYGAKRRNFKKKYFNTPIDWHKLPEHPDEIPYGYWY